MLPHQAHNVLNLKKQQHVHMIHVWMQCESTDSCACFVVRQAMLAVREGKEAVCARNFSDALQKAMLEKRLMGRAVDDSEDRPSTVPEFDLNKLMEQMMRAGVAGGGVFGRGAQRDTGGGGDKSKERDTKRRKVPSGPGETPFQDPEID